MESRDRRLGSREERGRERCGEWRKESRECGVRSSETAGSKD